MGIFAVLNQQNVAGVVGTVYKTVYKNSGILVKNSDRLVLD
jgi:hypothetical protein